MRAAVPLITACLLSSCARADYGERWPGSFAVAGGPQAGYAIKRVIERQRPAMLVADDGSVCRTSIERFSRTRVGKWVACNWALPNLDSAEPTHT